MPKITPADLRHGRKQLAELVSIIDGTPWRGAPAWTPAIGAVVCEMARAAILTADFLAHPNLEAWRKAADALATAHKVNDALMLFSGVIAGRIKPPPGSQPSPN